jgi:protein gp37
MTRLGPYEVHPFADAFPLVEGEEFDVLVADIGRHGLREPIIITGDRTVLVDGRNRYRACLAAGAQIAVKVLGSHYSDVEILDLILSLNMARRHLNPGQRAMVGLEYEKACKAATPQGRPKKTVADLPQFSDGLKSRDHAAKAVGASGRSVGQAKAVERDAPDLAEKVRAGQMALDAADRERKRRLDQMRRREPVPVKAAPARTMLILRTHGGEAVEYPEPQGQATFNQTPSEGISWASWSWNPVTGCLHGCDYCYAREIATSGRYKDAYPAGFTPLFHSERLAAPANTTIPAEHRNDPAWRRVFVCSMADLYGRWVPDEWIAQVHAAMLESPDWEYLTLTKFPARYVGLDLPKRAWVGTSVDEQKRVRIAEDAFRQIDGVAVKWLSLEPLREPLKFNDLSMFDWVVIGAQTETRQPTGTVPAFAPPFDWVADIYAQAREAGCQVHMKPNLARNPGMTLVNEYPGGAV